MKLPEIDPKTFYLVGKYAFFTIALIGLIRIVDIFDTLKAYDIFASLASSIFYFALAWFFSSIQSKEELAEVKDGDIIKMNKALDNLNLNGGKNAKNK